MCILSQASRQKTRLLHQIDAILECLVSCAGSRWESRKLYLEPEYHQASRVPFSCLMGTGTTVVQPGCCSFSTSEHRQLPSRHEKRTVSGSSPHTSLCSNRGTVRAEAFTFHFSISSCCRLYCLTSSSRTFFKPSEFVANAGRTSSTVLSTRTPLIIRKHFRSFGSGVRVSKTSLSWRMSGQRGL